MTLGDDLDAKGCAPDPCVKGGKVHPLQRGVDVHLGPAELVVTGRILRVPLRGGSPPVDGLGAREGAHSTMRCRDG